MIITYCAGRIYGFVKVFSFTSQYIRNILLTLCSQSSVVYLGCQISCNIFQRRKYDSHVSFSWGRNMIELCNDRSPYYHLSSNTCDKRISTVVKPDYLIILEYKHGLEEVLHLCSVSRPELSLSKYSISLQMKYALILMSQKKNF